MTKPRIPWKKIWQEFEEVYSRDKPDWPEQIRLISLIVGGHIGSWTVDWSKVWEEKNERFRTYGYLDSWGSEKLQIQRLVRKYLQEPKK